MATKQITNDDIHLLSESFGWINITQTNPEIETLQYYSTIMFKLVAPLHVVISTDESASSRTN
jgi:hypothetical protein